MKKTNFTFLNSQINKSIMMTFLFGFLTLCLGQLNAQCTLVCNEKINVGFDSSNLPDCEAQLDIEDVLSDDGTSCPGLIDSIVILNLAETHVFSTDGTITYDMVGQTYTFKVVDKNSGNSCWGHVLVEDKKPPVLDCTGLDSSYIKCFEEASFLPTILPDCDSANIVLEKIAEVRRDNTCNGSMPDSVLSVVDVTYVGVDSWGNQSAPCSFTYLITRIDSLGDIEFPVGLTKNDGNALKCDVYYPLDDKGNPDPIGNATHMGTGVPMLDSIPLYPSDGQYCNLLVDYTDDVIEIGCVTKIIRKWNVYEWTCGEQRNFPSFIQMIEIVDDEGPSIEALPDMTVSTSPWECSGRPFIPRPALEDNCKDDNSLTVDLSWTGASTGFIGDFQGDFVDLATGLNILVFTASDGCGSEPTRDTVEVLVEDKTSPVAVCISYTAVSLTQDGTAKVYATSFDNGSYDECLLDRMEVRRMDNGVPCGNELTDTDFDEYVEFCCTDIGTNVVVVFRVYDASGNYNDCMVNVDVQDKLPPAIVCPPDLTVGCGFDFANLNIFGTIAQDAGSVGDIVIDAPYLIDFGGNIGNLTDGYAIDNCKVDVTTSDTDYRNQCNSGDIVRVFTATDPGNRSTSCDQVITFTPIDTFDRDDITFPRDTAIIGCADPDSPDFDPEALGRPLFDEDECDLVGYNYDDEVYPFNGSGDNACFKIIRTWKVIDWCQMDAGADVFTWTDEQIIKVSDDLEPQFLGDYADKTVCTYDPTCKSGFIELTASGTDNCTVQLRGSYEIDTDNDGSIDITPPSTLGGLIDASGDYPIGTHRIIFSFQDRCGNITRVEQLFTIFNCKAPTPYAIDGLAVDLMPVDDNNDGTPDGGMVELWASHFDAGSYHACGYDVIVSFSADTTDKSRVFTCNDFGLNDDIELWATIVTPMGDLVQAYAITSLDVQDNMNVCPAAPPTATQVDVTGVVATVDEVKIDDVKVALEGSELSDALTGNNGFYAFEDMPIGGNYILNPVKNDDSGNGVSTLDLVMIQRHILGIREFDSPYQLVAADINKDGSLKASDILELRKVILGIYDEFKSNNSWRFIDKGYTFRSVAEALNDGFPETYAIKGLNADMKIDFVGVKIGDVDRSVEIGNARGLSTRSNHSLTISMLEKQFTSGQFVEADLKATEDIQIIGIQASFALNKDLELLNIRAGQIDVSDYNYIYDQASGLLTISIDQPHGIDVKAGDILFTVEMEAGSSGTLSGGLSIVDGPVQAEIYNSNEEILEMTLTVENDAFGPFEVFQNTPNPFSDHTQIDFVLPEAMNTTFKVFDVTGKQIYQERGQYPAGRNTISVSAQDLHTSGVVYYHMEAGKYFTSKKMVILK